MGQIHGANMGSPAVIVTPQAELLITGSVVTSGASTLLEQIIHRDVSEQILTELQILNSHMAIVTGEKLTKEDIRR